MEINVDNKIINYIKINDEDYISITDMLNKRWQFLCYRLVEK